MGDVVRESGEKGFGGGVKRVIRRRRAPLEIVRLSYLLFFNSAQFGEVGIVGIQCLSGLGD